ncbi:unnamed protein product [Miscanthus lutarioriparius]|uniref:Uncharacterized protein n=1 Tax=Miscanthus lutarioriparius TaxID=422564 RepID=A0A811NFY3_9POAL|nr:unnamed protein product [Miscanthus lutarioriparius]
MPRAGDFGDWDSGWRKTPFPAQDAGGRGRASRQKLNQGCAGSGNAGTGHVLSGMGLILPQMEGAELAGVLILEELVYREENCSPADIYVPADVNHEKAKSLEKRVADLEQCLCICSSVVESKERSIDTLKRRYGNLFVDAVRMCRQFNGVLSVVAIGLDDPSPIPEEVKFFYDGLRPPKTHIEQLVAVLVTLLNHGL